MNNGPSVEKICMHSTEFSLLISIHQNFYKTELNKEEMYIRYIHKLYDLHLKAQNYTGTTPPAPAVCPHRRRTHCSVSASMSPIFKHWSESTNPSQPTCCCFYMFYSACVSQRRRTPCCCMMSYWSGQTDRSGSSSTTPCRASGKEKSICISQSSRTSTGGRWAWTHHLFLYDPLLAVRQKKGEMIPSRRQYPCDLDLKEPLP